MTVGDGGMVAGISGDLLRPFQLERSSLRGRVARLGDTLDTILTRHDYPEPVSRQLGEMIVLAATLAGALKFNGTFSLQTRSDGPISLMVVDCTNDGAMRGYARYDRERLETAGDDVPGLFGPGRLAVTVDQNEAGQTYQGIVELSGASLTECMQTYFRQSEQLSTGLKVAVGRPESAGGRWQGGGIMIQRMPEADDEQAIEDWRRTMLLLGTASDRELTNPLLPVDTLLLRLFHEEGVRVFRPQPLSFRCRCSQERVEALLRTFPAEELDDMKRPDGMLEVTCQFCNRSYVYDDAELARLHGRKPH
jgi:molecular chaperone Hsp33